MNAGVDKNSFLGTEFSLTFITVDDIMEQLIKLGPGEHIYKVDISHAFRHLKVDKQIMTCLDFIGMPITLMWQSKFSMHQ